MAPVLLEIPSFGLSNKTRTLLAFHEIARRKKVELVVLWIVNKMSPARFLDNFEPLPHTRFVSKTEFANLRKKYPKATYFKGQGKLAILLKRHGVKISNDLIKRLYQLLKPVPTLQQAIDDTIKARHIRQAVGLHIRRTDHVSFIKRLYGTYSDDKYFDRIIEKSPKEQKFYLSTDNEETQSRYIKKYPDRIIVFAPIHKSKEARKTGIDHAVADLYLLANSRKIYGSIGSSFSEFAKYLYVARK